MVLDPFFRHRIYSSGFFFRPEDLLPMRTYILRIRRRITCQDFSVQNLEGDIIPNITADAAMQAEGCMNFIALT